MDDHDWITAQFEEHRSHLRSVGYRMLGSITEADDAVQEAWLRLARTDTSDVDNLRAWLTTVVARICLNVLRSRRTRAEQPLVDHLPDPIVSADTAGDPEQEALLADSVGLALLVVLETLPPAERMAFVLHDMFSMSFDEIAPIVNRSSTAARQLASRARRRVSVAPVPDADLARQRRVVEAFLAASRNGDFDALIAVLDPEVVLRADTAGSAGVAVTEVRGADAVAGRALMFSRPGQTSRTAVVNGAIGVLSTTPAGALGAIMAFTIAGDRVVEIDILADPARLRDVDLPDLD